MFLFLVLHFFPFSHLAAYRLEETTRRLERSGRGVELLAQGIRPCDSTQGVWPRCETLGISGMMRYTYRYICIHIYACVAWGAMGRTSGVVLASLNL